MRVDVQEGTVDGGCSTSAGWQRGGQGGTTALLHFNAQHALFCTALSAHILPQERVRVLCRKCAAIVQHKLQVHLLEGLEQRQQDLCVGGSSSSCIRALILKVQFSFGDQSRCKIKNNK